MENITKINCANYIYEYTISNNTGELKVRDSAVEYLEIVDNLFLPFKSGIIEISDPFSMSQGSFMFRGDGTDKLNIKLKSEKYPNKNIDYTFILSEERNITDVGTPAGNTKVFEFIDIDESKLRIKFAYSKKATDKVGDAIKKILQDFKLPIGSEFESGDLDIKSLPEALIPGVSYRVLDYIYYLLRYAYIKDGGLATKLFLSKDKTGYTLKSLTKMFARNKELVYESFSSGDLVDNATNATPNNNNPPPEAQYKPYMSNTTSYNFSAPPTKVNNSLYMNTLVVGYDHILGTSKMREIRLKDVLERWKTRFVDVFSSIGGAVKKCVNLTDVKKQGEFRVYSLPFTFEDCVNIAEADIVNNLLFTNMQLSLMPLGDLERVPGMFIDIFKLKNDANKVDTKLMGRWFVTSVVHRKVKQVYTNEIICMKAYAGPTFTEQDGTIE
jgi:hypothetical protein